MQEAIRIRRSGHPTAQHRNSRWIRLSQYVMSGKLLMIERNISNFPIRHHLLPTDRFVSTITNIWNMLEPLGRNVPTLYKHQPPQAPLYQSYYIILWCEEEKRIDSDNRIQELLAKELWFIKLNIKTRPDTQPMATVDAVTAEYNGRYSRGNQNKFSELHVIHLPSELTPWPWRRGFW